MKTQIWCAVSTYVLIAIVKKQLHLNAWLYTCLQILLVSVFEKTEISCALQGDNPAIDLPANANQLNLFNIQPDSSGVAKSFTRSGKWAPNLGH